MDNLFAGIGSSPDEKTQSTVKLSRAGRFRWGESGSLPGWQLCRGISGSFRVEWVAGFDWNQWQPWSGIRNSYTYIYISIAICYFGGKYGRLLLAHLTDKLQRANPTGLYRREGVVRIKERKSVFEAPFIEFDAYLIHTPSGRGGRYFNLVLQHRYSKHPLWMKGLVTDAMNQNDVYAYWDMVQQFMDVSGPLPDVPIFEPFRSRDPVTREWDERTDRDPFKWRKVTSDSWRKNHEQTHRNRLRNTNFHHPCILDAHIQGRGLPMPDEPRGEMLA
ncbi:MAG: hypothetical protein MH219_19525 [Marinobacter sp.]|nr:hypothetical protein [Marinobacter sp.]